MQPTISAALIIISLALAPTLAAGPLATVHFHKGRRIRVEILGSSNGVFKFKSAGTDETFSAFDQDIESLDFGPQPQLRPTRRRTRSSDLDPFRHALEMRQYDLLMQRVSQSANQLHDQAGVRAFQHELKQALAAEPLTPEKRRDLKLALAAVAFGLSNRWRGARLLRELQAEYPGDNHVAAFAKLLRNTPLPTPARKSPERIDHAPTP